MSLTHRLLVFVTLMLGCVIPTCALNVMQLTLAQPTIAIVGVNRMTILLNGSPYTGPVTSWNISPATGVTSTLVSPYTVTFPSSTATYELTVTIPDGGWTLTSNTVKMSVVAKPVTAKPTMIIWGTGTTTTDKFDVTVASRLDAFYGERGYTVIGAANITSANSLATGSTLIVAPSVGKSETSEQTAPSTLGTVIRNWQSPVFFICGGKKDGNKDTCGIVPQALLTIGAGCSFNAPFLLKTDIASQYAVLQAGVTAIPIRSQDCMSAKNIGGGTIICTEAQRGAVAMGVWAKGDMLGDNLTPAPARRAFLYMYRELADPNIQKLFSNSLTWLAQ